MKNPDPSVIAAAIDRHPFIGCGLAEKYGWRSRSWLLRDHTPALYRLLGHVMARGGMWEICMGGRIPHFNHLGPIRAVGTFILHLEPTRIVTRPPHGGWLRIWLPQLVQRTPRTHGPGPLSPHMALVYGRRPSPLPGRGPRPRFDGPVIC